MVINDTVFWWAVGTAVTLFGSIAKIALFLFKRIENLNEELSLKCSRDEMQAHLADSSKQLSVQIEITRNLLIEHISSLKMMLNERRQ